MKHRILVLLLIAWLAAVVLPPKPSSATTSLLNGQQQYYSVQLRNDKQAIVYSKVVFEAGSSDQSKIEFTLPKGVSVTNLSAQQILGKSKAKECSVYETLEQWTKRQPTRSPTAVSPSYEQNKLCVTYAEQAIDEDFDYVNNSASGSTSYYSPDYYSYRSPAFEYKDIDATQSGQTLSLELPNAVKARKQGAVLISYTSSDYVSGALGYFNYDFRTLGTTQMIDEASVAINFDEDLYSRQASQTRTTDALTSGIAEGALSAGASSYKSKSTDSTQMGIGQGGRYIQTQSKMLPGDTLSVHGVFATKPVLLYGKQIVFGLALLTAAILAVLLFRRYRKSHPRTDKSSSANRSSTSRSSSHMTAWWHGAFSAPGAAPRGWKVVKSSLVGILATGFGLMAASLLFLPSLNSYDTSGLTQAVFTILYIVSIASILIFGLIIIPGISAYQHGLQHLRNWAVIHLAAILGATLILWLLFSVFAGTITGIDGPVDQNDCINCGR